MILRIGRCKDYYKRLAKQQVKTELGNNIVQDVKDSTTTKEQEKGGTRMARRQSSLGEAGDNADGSKE